MNRAVTVTDTVLKIDGLTFARNGQRLFNDLNLQVKRGESVAILGGSGSGKSTLFDLIFHTDSKTRQFIEFDNKHAALVLQDGALLDHLSVIDNLRLVNSYAGRPCSEADLLQYLEDLNIPSSYATRQIHTLSGGEQRRVAIARSLVRSPQILVFDEPDAGLDMANRKDMGKVLRGLVDQHGKTIILATHDPLLASMVADRVLQLADGNLQELLAWDEAAIDDETIELRRKAVEALAFELRGSVSDSGHRAKAGDNIFWQLVRGVVTTIVKFFHPPPAPGFYLRTSARTFYMTALTGVVFYFIVGLMLGATTIVVVHNLTTQSIKGVLKLFIDEDFVLNQLNGIYIAYFAPAIGGILFIARSGSIKTAWLGALSFGKQIKALRVLGVDPDLYLRSPIFVALLLSYVLTVLIFAIGIWVGSFTTAEYIYEITNAAQLLSVDWDMFSSVDGPIKVVIYGVLLSLMIVSFGMARKPHINAVARHTTLTIIYTTLAISLCELGFALRGG